jgi:hypothetical protein
MERANLDDIQRRRRVGLVATVAAGCSLVAVVLLAPREQDDLPVHPAIAKPTALEMPPPHPPRVHDPEFRRLAAQDAPLRDNFKAYGWIKECLMERDFTAHNIKLWPHCGLSDQYVGSIELRKQLVTRLALAGSFGAVTDVHMEGPNGLHKAFASDPKGHARLLDKAYKVGLEKGEPAALGGEAFKLRSHGDMLRLVGLTQAARAKHVQALADELASVVGLAKQNGRSLVLREDPKVQEVLRQYDDRLEPLDRDAAAAEGFRMAEAWQPLCPLACQVDR